MGALTSNSKRDPYPNYPDFHISKEPRLFSMHQTHSHTPGSSKSIHFPIRRHPGTIPERTLGVFNSIASRISKYPESTSKFRREVHAPCRTLKFGLCRSKHTDCSENKKAFACEMGNFFGKRVESAKKKALDAVRLRKDKQLIDVDNEVQTSQKEVDSADSSVEEVAAMEVYGREGRSVVLDQSSRGGVLSNKGDDDDDVKIVEERSAVTVDRDMRVEHGGKMLNSVENAGWNIEDVEVYKQLLERAERRSGRLKELVFDIDLNEKKRSLYRSTRPVKKPSEKDVSVEAFTPLTKEEESEVDYALSRQCRRKVVVSHTNSNIDITGEILSCLKPVEWLNDEVINLYLELLKEREKREPKKFLKCHFFNTFFYKKLTSGAAKKYDYKSVRRWTTERKLGYFLIDCDKIFVPVHRGIHWCLAVINKKDEKFQYLDSLKGRDCEALEFLAKYFVDEVKDKSKKDIDVSNWEREVIDDIPAQRNGYDCGVFMIKYADFYSRDISLCFSQEHMPYFRMRTAKEILRLRAD